MSAGPPNRTMDDMDLFQIVSAVVIVAVSWSPP